MRSVSTVLLALVLVPGTLLAQSREDDLKAASEAATQGLAALAKLVTQENYRALGFTSPEEAGTAALGRPFMEFHIGLGSLQEFTPETAVAGLLTRVGEVTFPVEVDGVARSSISVSDREGRWSAGAFGAPSFIAAATETRQRLMSAMAEPGDVWIVRVPALNVVFLAHEQEGRLWFTPIVDDARFGFVRGESLPAVEALTTLAPAAREHNGLPT